MSQLRFLILLCGIILTAGAAPTNDLFKDRKVLSPANTISSRAEFTSATREPGEPHPGLVSLWWEWTAPYSGGAGCEVHTTGQALAVVVYDRAAFVEMQVVSSPAPSISSNGYFNASPKVTFRASKGTTYYFAVCAPNSSYRQEVDFMLRPGPANDDFSQAEKVSGLEITRSINFIGATYELGEPPLPVGDFSASVWYRWNPGIPGKVRIRPFSASATLFRGASLRELVLAASATNGLLVHAVTANDDLYLRVTPHGGQPLFASVRIQALPLNDDFAGRTILTGPTPATKLAVPGGSREEWEDHPFPQSIWWEWTSPYSGGVGLEGSTTGSEAVLIVYADKIGSLHRLNSGPPAWPSGSRVGFRAELGQKYYFALVGRELAGEISLRLTKASANDDFLNARMLAGPTSTVGTLFGASIESGEPGAPAGATGSLWWKWAADAEGAFGITASSSTSGGWVNVYKGEGLAGLAAVTSAPFEMGIEGTVAISAAAGEIFYIQITNDGSGEPGLVSLKINSSPPHDDFANAQLIAGNWVTGKTLAATLESNETSHGLGTTVWHKFIPQRSSGYGFWLSGVNSNATHRLDLFRGVSLDQLSHLESCSNSPTLGCSVSQRLEAGQSYYLRVDAVSGIGNYGIGISQSVLNDEFANARPIAVGHEVWVDTSGTGREEGEPAHIPGGGGSTVWFEFVAPETGGYYLETLDTTGTIHFAVYRLLENGDAWPLELVPLQGAGDYQPFRAQAGERYRVSLVNTGLLRGVTFYLNAAPPNDDFADASAIGQSQVTGHALGATTESEEPETAGMGVWYRWQAPATGSYVTILEGGEKVSLFRGIGWAGLKAIGGPGGQIVAFRAEAGEVIHFNVRSPSDRSFSLRIVAGVNNDDFSTRLPLVKGATNSAPYLPGTREPDEPNHWQAFPSSGTIWWSFTPEADGPIRIEVPGEGLSAIAVYTGTSMTDLNSIASRPGRNDRDLSFFAQAGVEYLIAQHDPSPGLKTEIFIGETSANDLFASAVQLETGVRSENRHLGATIEPGEIPWSHAAAGTLWFKWVAPSNGVFYFLSGFGAITQGALYRGDALASLELIDAVTNHLWRVAFTFSAVEGEVFHASLRPGDNYLDYSYAVSVKPGDPHDDISNAQFVAGLETTWIGSTEGASVAPGERNPYGFGAASVWARWVAPIAGNYRLMAQSSSAAVFKMEGTQLVEVTRRLASEGIEFSAVAGLEYLLQFVSPRLEARPFGIRLGPVPKNDLREHAEIIKIDQGELNLLVSNWVSLTFPGYGHAMWWEWEAPTDAVLQVHSSGRLHLDHGQRPTLGSSLKPEMPQDLPNDYTYGYTNLVSVVGKGQKYLIAAVAPPTTNLAVHFKWSGIAPINDRFQTLIPKSLRLETVPWVTQQGGVNAGGDALMAIVTNSQSASIEGTFPGPGTLYFWTKVIPNPSSRFSVFASLKPPPVTVPHSPFAASLTIRNRGDWQLYSVPLPLETNVVRWQLRDYAPWYHQKESRTIAWIDNVEVALSTEPAGRLFVQHALPGQFRFGFSLLDGQPYGIETSTNLRDWVRWTNLPTVTEYNSRFLLSVPQGETNRYFRGVRQ